MQQTYSNGEPNVQKVALFGVIGAIAVFVIIVGLQALFYNLETAEREAKLYVGAPRELGRLRAEQLEELYSYRWIDQPQGIVGIPIDTAMELIVRESTGTERVAPSKELEEP
ncbi:MAG: hypothetical protein JSU86_14430 [Phycisphaerales bacterium]|nr:MAG: hypothetical protein JSU86_14430 [Phycisphaerales bacterium]